MSPHKRERKSAFSRKLKQTNPVAMLRKPSTPAVGEWHSKQALYSHESQGGDFSRLRGIVAAFSVKKAVTFSGCAASSDASLIKPKLRSKYSPVPPAAVQLILHLSYWPSAVFVQLWGSHGHILHFC